MASIDDIRERLSIEDVVGGQVQLKRAGSTYKGLCPFHNEKSPSFIVTPSRGRYHCFGCLPPGSLIKTAEGPRPIDEIVAGDRVYTLDGQLHRVLLTHIHEFEGELVRLIGSPFAVPVLLTPNHKIPLLRAKSRREKIVEAGDIKPGNYLQYPLMQRQVVPLSWEERPGWRTRFGPLPHPLPESVDVDLFAEWLGWYLAEGSTSQGRNVNLSLGDRDEPYVARLQELTQAIFGVELRIVREGRNIEAWTCHALLARWLKHHVGNGAHHKRLPDFVWGWTPVQQWTLLAALLHGDGRCPAGTRMFKGAELRSQWRLTLASAALVDDVRDLLLHNGIVPRVTTTTKAEGRIHWIVAMPQNVEELWGQASAPDRVEVRIRRVERVRYQGPVYNLTVEENHTYATLSGVVNNCGVDGDIFKFVMETKHIGFLDAAQLLADKAGVTLDKPDQDSPENKLKDRVYEMNAAAAVYFQQMLAAPPGTQARAYLTRRAITQKTTEDFALGYAPGHGELCKRLRDAGYSDEEMVDGGLAVAPEGDGPLRDRFYGRLMFPIRDAKGHIQGFGGRVLDDGQPKYLNSPATAVFDKSRALYAIERAADAIRSAREVVVVEGYMDALRAHQEGFANVVATLGTAITEQNLRALARYAPRLVLALDADPAGQRAAIKGGLVALKTLPKTTASGTKREPTNIYVAALPEGQDPDDAIAADPAVWRDAISGATPLMDHYVALVEVALDRGKPTWRQEAIDTLVPAIGDLDGVGLQQTYIARLSDLTGVDARYLRDEVTRVSGVPVQAQAGRRRERAAAPPPPPAPDAVDPIRTTEEYLVGLLLLHRPLAPEVRATLETYAPGDIELAALLSALLDGYAPDPAREELAERLAALAGKRPPVSPGSLLLQVHDLVTRVGAERSRRELLDLGEALSAVDRETAREMDGRVLKVMALKEQAEVRYQREQMQHRRQPAMAGEEL